MERRGARGSDQADPRRQGAFQPGCYVPVVQRAWRDCAAFMGATKVGCAAFSRLFNEAASEAESELHLCINSRFKIHEELK